MSFAPTPIADIITEMLKNCIPMETIIIAVRSYERSMSTRHAVDETAERRRAWDREYRRKRRAMSVDPPDIHPKQTDVGKSTLFVEEKTQQLKEVKKERKSAGEKLPPDWKPKANHYAVGAELGMSQRDVDERAVAMREWCEANANRSITTKANWDSAFMGVWVRQGHRKGNSNGKVQGGSAVGAWDRVLERSIAEDADRAAGEDTLFGFQGRPVQRP